LAIRSAVMKVFLAQPLVVGVKAHEASDIAQPRDRSEQHPANLLGVGPG
jgi:hypothetical protein